MLVTVEQVKEVFAQDPANTDRDTALTECIKRAQSELERWRVLEQGAPFVAWLNGSDAVGPCSNVLAFPPGRDRMVLHEVDVETDPGPPPVTEETLVVVEEDGVALTVDVGYSTDADVLLVGGNKDRPARLYRGNSNSRRAWSCGDQNVKVTYRNGYTSANLPDRFRHLISEMAWKLMTSPDFENTVGAEAGGRSVSWDKRLSEFSRGVLEEIQGLAVA